MTRRLVQDTRPDRTLAVPRPGDILQGKYRVERELGSGGWGVVYEVEHLVTEAHFAIKWLVTPEGDEDALRRFVREARIAGRIRHPHVVDVYDIYLEHSGCFFVMELLWGETLGARLRREGPLRADIACELFLSCLDGIAAAHQVGVIHRDLKPDNIFLCRTTDPHAFDPKVLDFGISRVTAVSGETQTTETRKGTIIGTPAYMAPEQLRGDDVDARTDVYGLGVTLYEALSGARAFDASTYPDLVVKIATGDAAPLRVPDLPPGLVQVVSRAMHRDPEQRYASAAEFAAALRTWNSASSVAISPLRSVRRSHIHISLAVVGLAVIGGGILFWRMTPSATDDKQVLPARTQVVSPSAHVAAAVPEAFHREQPDPPPVVSAPASDETPARIDLEPPTNDVGSTSKGRRKRRLERPQPLAAARVGRADAGAVAPVSPPAPALPPEPRPKPPIVLDGI